MGKTASCVVEKWNGGHGLGYVLCGRKVKWWPWTGLFSFLDLDVFGCYKFVSQPKGFQVNWVSKFCLCLLDRLLWNQIWILSVYSSIFSARMPKWFPISPFYSCRSIYLFILEAKTPALRHEINVFKA